MREYCIRARHKWRYNATTDSKHSMPGAPNLLARNFTPAGAEPGVDGQHHVHPSRRRLTVPDYRCGPVQPRDRRLVDQAPEDGRHRHRGSNDGVVPPQGRLTVSR